MIIFNRFLGRFGNNIKQLSNIIDIAIEYKHNIKINPKNLKFFDLTIIENYFNKYNNNEIITDNGWHFLSRRRTRFSNDIFEKNVEERNKLLQKAFLLNNIIKLDENDLVIHIRSGDIFSSKPHTGYIPPPLSYYIKEIDKHKYKKIHIVCEDRINPVVNELLKLYKNAFHEKNTLEKDIKIILGATNIIFSVGSFIPELMKLSYNIRHLHGKDCNNEELQDYYKVMKPWKNTEEQRNYILTYNYN